MKLIKILKKVSALLFTDLIYLRRLNALLLSGTLKNKLLLGGIVGILVWQFLFLMGSSIFVVSTQKDARHARKDATGFSHKDARHFHYFHYHLNLFPVATTGDEGDDSAEGARAIIQRQGNTLIMEREHWSRLGENLRIFLYWPNALITGSTKDPSIRPTNALFLILALLSVYVFFFYYKMPALGVFIVLLFGSSPFLLYEVYGRENYFSYMVSSILVLLGPHLSILLEKADRRWIYILPITVGIWVGCLGNIRAEFKVVLPCFLILYLLSRQLSLVKKAVFVLLACSLFFLVDAAWKQYFDRKFSEAFTVVQRAGGIPYTGHRIPGHTLWHPIFCGLGDFDTKYGYAWDDRVAYAYALPKLNQQLGTRYTFEEGALSLDQFYDEGEAYYIKLETLPEYEVVLKQKVLSDVRADPLWFLTIVVKRIYWFFYDTSPLAVSFSVLRVYLPFTGLLVLPFFFIFWRRRRWLELNLLLFSLPLGAGSILIHAGNDTTYNSIFHLFFAALALSWAAEYLLRRRQDKVAKSKGLSG